MTPGRILVFAFIVTALGTLAAMRLWTMPIISAGTGGLDMFDVLIDGYSPDYVAQYLGALTDQARATYLGPQRVLDTILPVALAGTLSISAFLLARPWGLALAVALAVVPLFYFAFDMLENAQVAAILTRGEANVGMAEAASRFTVFKAQALRFAVMAVLFVLAGRAFEMAFSLKEK